MILSYSILWSSNSSIFRSTNPPFSQSFHHPILYSLISNLSLCTSLKPRFKIPSFSRNIEFGFWPIICGQRLLNGESHHPPRVNRSEAQLSSKDAGPRRFLLTTKLRGTIILKRWLNNIHLSAVAAFGQTIRMRLIRPRKSDARETSVERRPPLNDDAVSRRFTAVYDLNPRGPGRGR